MASLTIHLWYDDLDDPETSITIARIAVNLIRFIWGLIDTWRMGPYLQHWLLFIKERRTDWGRMTWKNRFVYAYFLLFLVVFVLPDAFHNLHWTFGVQKLDGPLTGCIATHSFCVFFKIFMFETLIRSKGEKAIIAVVMTFLFLSQWFLMLDMYTESLLPIIHCSGESVFVINSLFYVCDYFSK